ncbi:[FeFe] hydrogenase H-cluster maturation GTPase HydF [Desulfitispora alkaliphila]|uniref:[FeFe] hydrogenase H-cluster maturation GTPase HydF n=1 Tax=Desulfitispora alkaliphila TaxID=622674 RepID=UPI003D1BFC53
MSLNETPRANRVHIAFFGRRNAGKSSLINAVTGQEIALVSSVKGTTADPVYKPMELLPVGPVVIIDTAGLDDVGELGELRKQKTLEVLHKTDLAVLVVDAEIGLTQFERETADIIRGKKIPAIGVINKTDKKKVSGTTVKEYGEQLNMPIVLVSALKSQGVEELKKAIIDVLPEEKDKFKIVGDLISPGEMAVLVVPIDGAAPKGRLIMPQQQTIRDIMDNGGMAVVVKETGLKQALGNLAQKPKLVITDSQVFQQVARDTPDDIFLTSFSILFARNKGDLGELVKGARTISRLKDGDKVLIAEACTHHRQPEDIGRVKIPKWIEQKTGKDIIFEFSNGVSFPDNLREYALVVHCGGCMLNKKAMHYRIEQAVAAQVPIVNYGVLIAYVQGILDRAIEPFSISF